MKKAQIFKIHSFTGIIGGLGLLLLSLSGSLLCFKEEIRHFLHPVPGIQENNASVKDYQLLYNDLHRKYPDYCIVRIRIADRSSAPLPEAHLIAVDDPEKKLEVVYQGGQWRSLPANWLHYAEELHYYMLLPRYPGMIVNFIFSMALVALTLTGFVIYRRKIIDLICFRSALKFSKAATWHTSLGVVSLAFNAVMATTSLIITFAGVAGGPRDTSVFMIQPPANFDLNRLMQQASEANPYKTGVLKNVTFLSDKTMFHYDLLPAHRGALSEYSRIMLEPASGKLISRSGRNDTPVLKALNSSVPFHFGDFSNIAMRMAYCLGGITLSLLTFTGSILYFRRKQRTRLKKDTKKEVPSRKLFIKGIRYGTGIIISGCLLGAMWGVFMGNIFHGSIYLSVIFVFPVVLGLLLVPVAWISWLLLRLFRPFSSHLLLQFTIISTGAFLISLLWLLLVTLTQYISA